MREENYLLLISKVLLAETEDQKQKALGSLRRFVEGAPIDQAEDMVKKILFEMGGQERFLGYKFTVTAIMMCIQDTSLMYRITYGLYPAVGERYGRGWAAVERNIRHFIEKIYEEGCIENASKYFGYVLSSEKGCLTNAEFICKIANIVRSYFPADTFAHEADR